MVIDLPGTSSPEVLAAVRSVLPPDDGGALDLMRSADGAVLVVQEQLAAYRALPAGQKQPGAEARVAKRLAVVATAVVLAAGFAPATAANQAGGKVSPSIVVCCKG